MRGVDAKHGVCRYNIPKRDDVTALEPELRFVSSYIPFTLEVVAREGRPAPHRAAQCAREKAQNIMFTAHTRRAPPPDQLWEIPAGEESAILSHCELSGCFSKSIKYDS